MPKKVTINATPVYDAIGEATAAPDRRKKRYGAQGTASPEEQEQRRAENRTQGRKGCSMPRINVALTVQNHDFLKVMGRMTGRGMTQVVNEIIDAYIQQNGDVYFASKELQRAFDAGLERE